MMEFMGKAVEYTPKVSHAFKQYVEGFAWVMGKGSGMSKEDIIAVLSKAVQETVEHLPLP